MEAQQSNDALFNFYGWLHTNWKRVAAAVIVIVVSVAVVSLWSWHSEQQDAEAGQTLLNVPGLTTPAVNGQPPSHDELMKIAQDYSGANAAIYAQLLAARTSFLLGKYQDSEQAFSKFLTDHPNDALVPMAQIGLAASLEGEGKLTEAMAKYKEVAAAHSTEVNIIVPLKLTMGRVSEEQNKPDSAFAYYGDVVNMGQRDQRSPWVVEAMQRLRLLVAKHPEVMPAQSRTASAPAPQPSSPMLNPSASETELAPANGAAPAPAPAQSQAPASNAPFGLPPLQIPSSSAPVTKP